MKTTKITQARFINGSDGHDTQEEFNQAMRELAFLNPRFERDGNSFWIFYSEILEEPESLAEKHEMEGEKAHCSDCPFFARPMSRFGVIDGRAKHGTCGKHGTRQHIDSTACDDYYKLATAERRRFK